MVLHLYFVKLLVLKYSFKNSLIIHEENTKKFRIFICDLHNVLFENYFANELTRSLVFEAI
jgi:hypothetical protein